MTLSANQLTTLAELGTATVWMQLFKRGFRACSIEGAVPLNLSEPIAGPAFTVRFVPMREDVSTLDSYRAPESLRTAIEAMPEGCIAVCDTGGEQRAGTIGDILAARMVARGVVGFVSDGPVRDSSAVIATGLPIWSTGAVAPASIGALHYIGHSEVIGCGNAQIRPGEIIVADRDGAIVVPVDLAMGILEDGIEQDRFETWVQNKVMEGREVNGLYPPNEATLAEYEEWKKSAGL